MTQTRLFYNSMAIVFLTNKNDVVLKHAKLSFLDIDKK